MAHHYDDQIEVIIQEQNEQLTGISEVIKCIEPYSSKHAEFIYAWQNREKIYKNKKLIDLLG